jgi:uncharacterized protein (TIGR00255 family)
LGFALWEAPLPLSMTGFGAAAGPAGGGRLRVDVRTVNHRHLTLQFKLPDELAPHEGELRVLARQHFDRGQVTTTARWDEVPAAGAAFGVNHERAREVIAALRELQTAFGLPGDVDLTLVARQPEVLERREAQGEPVAWTEVEAIVRAAFEDARRLRTREGAALAAELSERLASLAALADAVERRAPARLTRERDRIRKHVAELADGVAVDEGRLAQEIALLADRLDVREEIVRLGAHVAGARAALDRDGPVGKELGFLAQEMLRETNTIGSKANDADIAKDVIAMKGELEKVREQLENLE